MFVSQLSLLTQEMCFIYFGCVYGGAFSLSPLELSGDVGTMILVVSHRDAGLRNFNSGDPAFNSAFGYCTGRVSVHSLILFLQGVGNVNIDEHYKYKHISGKLFA